VEDSVIVALGSLDTTKTAVVISPVLSGPKRRSKIA
jgi:hypothetical protein